MSDKRNPKRFSLVVNGDSLFVGSYSSCLQRYSLLMAAFSACSGDPVFPVVSISLVLPTPVVSESSDSDQYVIS